MLNILTHFNVTNVILNVVDSQLNMIYSAVLHNESIKNNINTNLSFKTSVFTALTFF